MQVPAWPHLSHRNPLLQKGQGFILTGVLAQIGGRETSGKERNLLMHLTGSGDGRDYVQGSRMSEAILSVRSMDL